MDWANFGYNVFNTFLILVGAYVIPRISSAAIFTSYFEVKKIYMKG